jgi:hypothetical protein
MLIILGITFKPHFKHVYRTCLKKALKRLHWEGEDFVSNYKRNSKARTAVVVGPQCLTQYNIYRNRYFGYAEKQTENPQALNAFPDKGNSLNTADILLRHSWLLHCCRLITVTYCFHSTVNARTFES